MSIRPGKADFPLYRWAGPTQNSCTLRIAGYDFSGATFLAQFRDYRDQSGDARISLSNAAANAEGVSCTVATEDGVTVSYVKCRVNETTVEAVATAISGGVAATDDQYPMVWDLQIDGGGLGKIRWIEGNAPIYAGVSQ